MPPGCTEFAAVKLSASSVVVNDSDASALSRVANATSEGELVRVGTWMARTVSESFGNTR